MIIQLALLVCLQKEAREQRCDDKGRKTTACDAQSGAQRRL